MIALFFLTQIGCDQNQIGNLEKVSSNSEPNGLPVGFDRRGGYIVFDTETNESSFIPVETAHPVLHFAGANLDGSMIAYTAIAKLAMGSPKNRTPITLVDSLALTLDDLVPTGELAIEKDGAPAIVSQGGEVATFAAWSPVDPDVIAYTTPKGNGEYGFVVVNVERGDRLLEMNGAFEPDYIAWSDDGQSIGLYGAIESNGSDTGVAFEDENVEESSYTFLQFDVQTGELIFDRPNQIDRDRIRPSVFDLGMNVEFEHGGHVFTNHYLGGDEVTIENKNGNQRIVKAEQIRHRSSRGIVYVNTRENLMELFAKNGEGCEGEGCEDEDIPVMGAMSVNYYIPMPAGTTVTFTQVGASYSGGGCSISSHTAASTMNYAIDIRDNSSRYDEVIAAAAGGTYAFYSSVTANCGDGGYDGSTCSDYSSSYRTSSTTSNSCLGGYYACSSVAATGYGWGNYVILSHADGYYTKYTHLENGSNFRVTSSASVAVSAGCWLADEGHTGNTCGSTGGCGDHLHYQRQNSGSRTGQSVSASFAEDSSITSTDCTSKTPTLGAMSCSL